MGILGIAFGLLPLVMNVVSGVEKLIGPGQGNAKKQAATAMISDALNIANTIHPSPKFTNSELMDGISQIIDGVVKVMNAVGAFQKS
jgi:hypothetical protein